MVNLTVEQPQMKLLKIEIHHGVNIERTRNLPAIEYNITKNKLMGAP